MRDIELCGSFLECSTCGLEVGTSVIVPDPVNVDEDMWNHSFVGTIVKIENGWAYVRDQDDNLYDLLLTRLRENHG